MRRFNKKAFLCFAALLVYACSYAQKENLNRVVAGFPVNYEEDSVGAYTLPDVLKLENGKRVSDRKTWLEKRRPELLKLFEEHQFGKMPPRPADMHFKLFDTGTNVFNNTAVRKQVTVYFSSDTTRDKMDLLMYLPKGATKPVPLLLLISFTANSALVADPGVKPGLVWTKGGKLVPAGSGLRAGKFDVSSFIAQGIGVATVYYGDIDPDFKGGLQYGIRARYLKSGIVAPAEDEWGTISAWAWGLSRAMDYFETDRDIDAKRIALQGTSRLGKTVLWAGAHDQRFKVVIASCSGEGGAALSRRNYGESISHMTDTSRYFYQFAAKRHSYSLNPDASPVDAHMLLALMAPRALLLQTGDTDYWSDPKGEFLAALAAEPVYRLFGKKGPSTEEMPAAGDKKLLFNPLGYYMHSGGHGPVPSDWPLYIEYLKKYL